MVDAYRWRLQRQNRENRRRRLMAARRKATHTKDDWLRLVAACGDRCVRCGDDGAVVKDHIAPLYQGGSDGVLNLQPLCRTCNSSKGPESTDFRPATWYDAHPGA